MSAHNTPDLSSLGFARTNRQTIAQRAALIRALLPETRSLAEVCCGDCTAQWAIYGEMLPGLTFCSLDVAPSIVAANCAAGVPCTLGDALDPHVLRSFLAYNVIFFGPPLSAGCDGHHALAFDAVQPGFAAFSDLLLGELRYDGTLVCIGPKTTHMGDIRRLYDRIRARRADFGLRLIHHSYATVTGAGVTTEPRLKYVELWFSNRLPDVWEVRRSGPDAAPEPLALA
jgi:hypothetical protein